jgi:hypothetical protein
MKTKLILSLGVLAVVAAGCETIDKINSILDNANGAISDGRSALSQVGSSAQTAAQGVNPSQQSGVKVPGAAAAPSSGKTGSDSYDMDGDGTEETVESFEADNGNTYVWWEEEGICYLLWDEGGVVQFAYNDCAATDGAYVCSLTADGSDIESCDACNTDGECVPCDDDSCEIPELGTTDPGGEIASCADGTELPADNFCDGTEDCADGSDESECLSGEAFICDDGTEVPIEYQCDGEPDCADQSDETGCGS